MPCLRAIRSYTIWSLPIGLLVEVPQSLILAGSPSAPKSRFVIRSVFDCEFETSKVLTLALHSLKLCDDIPSCS